MHRVLEMQGDPTFILLGSLRGPKLQLPWNHKWGLGLNMYKQTLASIYMTEYLKDRKL